MTTVTSGAVHAAAKAKGDGRSIRWGVIALIYASGIATVAMLLEGIRIFLGS